MSFNKHDLKKNQYMLTGSFRKKGYDWWWHSFTGINEKTGEEKAFFIEFFLCNPALGKDEPVFGQLPENKENHVHPSYLMVKAGSWGKDKAQLHRFFGWKNVNVKRGVLFSIQADDCYLDETSLRGSVHITKEDASNHPEWMCGSGDMDWDLKVEKKTAFNVGYGTSALFRFLKAFEMYWHAEGIESHYTGTVTYNGEKYIIKPERSYGYADKNWGRGFTSPWVWISSCDLTSQITGKKLENSVFDIGGGRPKIFFYALERQLLSAFLYKGKEYEFNFSKFWTGCRTEFSEEETEDKVIWHVKQENHHALMVTDAQCMKKDMLLVNYEAPDGSKRHNRLWNGGNGTARIKLYKKTKKGRVLIDDINAGHCGCEYGEYDQ